MNKQNLRDLFEASRANLPLAKDINWAKFYDAWSAADMSDLFDPPTNTFTGRERDASGKVHNISRTTCGKCKTVIAETHYGCCGFSLSGFGGGKCECKQRPPST